MKCSKAAIHRKTHRIPEIKFEDQRLTSFAGLVVYQSLFSRIGLKQQLAGCFRHLTVSPIFGHGVVVISAPPGKRRSRSPQPHRRSMRSAVIARNSPSATAMCPDG